jgi:hypothetical protein
MIQLALGCDEVRVDTGRVPEIFNEVNHEMNDVLAPMNVMIQRTNMS